MTTLKPQKTIIACFIICAALVLAPISLYIFKFGIGLWNDTSKWAELGSFFGGVLGPMLSFFSVILLLATVYLTDQSLNKSKESLEQQVLSSTKQDFDSIFFNQLKMLLSHIRSAHFELEGNNTSVDTALAENFKKLVQQGTKLDSSVYLPHLSQAIESFDQLVVLLESHSPINIDKKTYRNIVKSNLGVHFRWFVGETWTQLHPDEIEHINFLAEHYGAIKLTTTAKNKIFDTKF